MSDKKIKIQIKKNHFLLVTVIMLGILIVYKIIPLRVLFADKNIDMIISKSKTSLTNLDNMRNISAMEKYSIDKIDFDNGQELKHSVLGITGYTTDFFIDFSTVLYAVDDCTIVFTVYSDDGFRMSIDDVLIMEFTGDRPFSMSEKEFRLAKGIHTLKMSYYQGYGQLGLKAYYKKTDSGTRYFLGESSRDLKFFRN